MGFLFAILIAVIGLIVYGSLYPWTFVPQHLTASPIYLLLNTWEIDPHSRRFWFDIPVNIAIYIPLGMVGYLAFRRSRSRLVASAVPLLIGAILSASVEMLQLYLPSRHCSTLDLADNILGACLGVLAGMVFSAIVGVPVTGPDFHVRDRNAVALLFCWIAFLLFPLFPAFSIPGIRDKLAYFIHSRLVAPGPLLLSVAEWFAVARLLVAAGARPPLAWLAGFAALMPVQFIIIEHHPRPWDFEGAVLAMLIFLLCARARWADCAAGFALLIATVIRALTPFEFSNVTQPFSWIPFAGFLHNSWQVSISFLLLKIFQYGASIWLLARALFGLFGATFTVAIVLAVVEVLQRFSTEHVPEITDPLLAVLLGLAFAVGSTREPERRNG